MYTRDTLPKNAMLVPEGAECVFKGEIFDTYQWPQERFDGSIATYEMLKRPDNVRVLAVNKEGEVLVCDERQPGGIVRKNRFPAGRADPTDASPLAAAQRELAEETGWRFRDWKLLEVIQPEPKIEYFMYLFSAQTPIEQGEQMLDAGEQITTRWVRYEKLAVSELSKQFTCLDGKPSLKDLLAKAV